MSLTLKISSLVIRTLSKPIANQIKAQARDHEGFRKGNIRDTNASQRQAAAAAEAKKHIPTSPTVKTEADTKAEEQALAKAKAAAEEAAKPRKYRIRPLSESKAIESGANFLSETFLFLVAGGLIVFESMRSRRKESTRREGVEDRLIELEESERATREALVALEKELLALKSKHDEQAKPTLRILPSECGKHNQSRRQPWWNRAGGLQLHLISHLAKML
ncbi:hypothetical protein N7470_001581 [Penicillium chermesinum]|nr:hypothetical protein N7470_001581 [Penicillium chermesinum]